MSATQSELIVGLCIVLAVFTYTKYILGWSTKDFLKTLMSEFKDLASIKVSAGAINALALLSSFLLVVAYLVIPRVEKLFTLARAIPVASDTGAASIGAAAMILIGGVICVSLIRSDQ